MSSDPDVDHLFERICSEMRFLFGYREQDARSLMADYVRLFTDESCCERLGRGVQDVDFFFHEAPMGMAMRIHYFLGLKGSPAENDFVNWRAEAQRRLRDWESGLIDGPVPLPGMRAAGD